MTNTAMAYQALLDGRGDGFSTDNTEVLAWAIENKGYEVGITSLGNPDTIAPAVQKGNKELLRTLRNLAKRISSTKIMKKHFAQLTVIQLKLMTSWLKVAK